MCESFYVHYGFISSSAVYVYITTVDAFLLETQLDMQRNQTTWGSNEHHATGHCLLSFQIPFFPKTNYQQY